MQIKSKGFAHLILIIGVVLVGIVGIGYFAIKNGQIKLTSQKDVATQTTTPTTTTSEGCGEGYTPLLEGGVFGGCILNTSSWKTYRNEEYGFEIIYPDGLTLLEESGTTKLSRSIPHKHQSPCAMVGDEPPMDSVIDFSLSIEISQNGLGKTVANKNPFIKDGGYIVNNSLKTEFGFIDNYEVGALKGYRITSGAECGIYEYFFLIDENRTLIATRPWEVTTEYGGMPEVLNLPGLITDEQSEQYFNQILSTFKFLDEERNIVFQTLPESLQTDCILDSDCQDILSYNTCELFCVNQAEDNQKIISELEKSCESTLWDPPLSLNCGCIQNNCQLYE